MADEGTGEMLSLAYDRALSSGCEIADTPERGRASERGTCSYLPSPLMLIEKLKRVGSCEGSSC